MSFFCRFLTYAECSPGCVPAEGFFCHQRVTPAIEEQRKSDESAPWPTCPGYGALITSEQNRRSPASAWVCYPEHFNHFMDKN